MPGDVEGPHARARAEGARGPRGARREDRHRVARGDAEDLREPLPDDDARTAAGVLREVERADGRLLGHERLALWRRAPQQDALDGGLALLAVHRLRLGAEEREVEHDRRDALDALHLRDLRRERVRLVQRVAEVAVHLHVLPEADDLGLDLALEAAHDHHREQQRPHADRHAADRGHGHEAEKPAPLVAASGATEVAEGEGALEGTDQSGAWT